MTATSHRGPRGPHLQPIARTLLLAALGCAGAAEGATTVGAIAGEFAVSPTGAATYRIPITVAPGVNGLRPEVALAYSSQGPDGLAGMGWSLSGFSQVSRCALTRAVDGRVRGVRYDREDRYCLDGRPLVLVSGTYGADGAEYRTEVHEYQRVFSRGTQGSGPAWFEVQRPDGLTWRYGNDADSRIEAPGTAGDVRAWALNEVEDKYRQRMSFTYTEDAAQGEFLPAEVRWSWGAEQGPATARYRLAFGYQPRLPVSVRSGWVWGAAWRTGQRLATVDYEYDAGGGFARVHRYALAYRGTTLLGTQRSELASVTQCGPADCLPPTTFAWQEGSAGLNGQAPVPPGDVADALFGDYDGDGDTDAFLPANGNWTIWSSATLWNPPTTVTNTGRPWLGRGQLLDYNGDGRMDLLAPGPGSTWVVYEAAPSAAGGVVDRPTGIPLAAMTNVVPLDVDGDGLHDLVYVSGSSVRLRRNTGSGFGPEQASGIPDGGAPVALRMADGTIQPADFDGDGREDLLVARNFGGQWTWLAYLSNGSGFDPAGLPFTGVQPTAGTGDAIVLDVNGDGLSDVVFRQGTTWSVRLGQGGAAGRPAFVAPSCADPVGGATSAAGTIAIDVNADGRADLLRPWGGGWRVHLSDGQCYASSSHVVDLTGSNAGVVRLVPGDANGDGLADLFLATADNRWWVRTHGGLLPDLVVRITDGLGNVVQPSYEVLTGWTGYGTTGSAPAGERLLGGGPLAVVRQYTESTGLDGPAATSTTTFRYANARLDTTGRGFLGFGTVTSTDSRDGLTTQSDYLQSFPYGGRLARRAVSKGTAPVSVLAQSWRDYAAAGAAADPAADHHFVYLASETREEYEVDADGQSAGALVRRTTRTPLQWNFQHGVALVELTTTEAPQEPGVTYTESRAVQLNDSLRTAQGCLGLPDRVAVTRSAGDTGTQSRSSRYSYVAGTCRLAGETSGLEAPASQQLQVSYGYDAAGRMTSVSRAPADGSLPARQVTFGYDGAGARPATESRLIAGEPAHVTRHEWLDALGLEASRTDPQGRTTRWSYDDFGRLRQELRPAGATTVTRAACGACLATTARVRVRSEDGSGFWSEAQLDSRGRTVARSFALVDGTESRQLTEYDALGRVARESVPGTGAAGPWWVRYAWDLRGRPKSEDRPVSEAAPSGAVTRWVYSGLRTEVTDPGNRTRLLSWDAWGRLRGANLPLNGGAWYEWTAFGELASVLDAGWNTTTFEYDARGRRTVLASPDLGTRRTAWNAFGEVATETDARTPAVTISWTRDALGRLRQRTEPEGVTGWRYSTTAGGSFGQLQSVTAPGDGSGYAENYQYDGLGRLARLETVVGGASYATDYAYDANGELAGMTYPATVGGSRPQFAWEYRYGHLSAVSQVLPGWGSLPVYRVAGQDAAGRDSRVTFGDGVVDQQHLYDGANTRLAAIRSGPAPGSATQNYAYAWDAAGNLLERRDDNQGVAERYAYDALDRLTGVTRNGAPTLALSYSADGNVLAKSDVGAYTYTPGGPQPHAVRSVAGGPRGSIPFAYDANGNMTARGPGTLAWTSWNQPREVNVAGSGCSGDCTTLAYGPARQLLRQVTRVAGATTDVTYVAPHFEVERRGGTTWFRSHVFANGRIVYTQAEGTNLGYEAWYVLRDYQRSVDTLVRAAGTAADLQRQAFDAWGKRRNTDWSADPVDARLREPHRTARGYTGHEHLDGVRLVHMNARAEDPLLGRMLAPDPSLGSLLNPQSLNPYSYAGNNPTSAIDPSGLFLGRIGGFLQRAVRSVGHFVQRVVNRWGRTIVAAVAAYYTGGLVNDLYVDSAMQAGTYATVAEAEAAAPNLFLQGVAGGAAGGAVATGSLRGTVVGGLSGGAFAAVDAGYGGQYTAGRVVSEGVVGGVASVAQGGDFWRGFAFSGGAAGAEYAYRTLVRYGTDWGPGAPAMAKPDALQMPYRGVNNFGEAVSTVDRDCWLCLTEGGRPSQMANLVPGINAVAGMHDVFQRAWSLVDAHYPGGVRLRESLLLNVGAMAPAASITYPALLHGAPSVWLAQAGGG